MSSEVLLISILLAVLSGIVSLIFARISARGREKVEQLRTEFEKNYRETLRQSLTKRAHDYGVPEVIRTWSDIIDDSASASSMSSITSDVFISTVNLNKEIEKQVVDLDGRIQQIEARIPDQETVEKIASVNDAILATQFENLTESVKGIEGRLLTRWDVAKIMFQILASLGVLTGIVSAILTLTTRG